MKTEKLVYDSIYIDYLKPVLSFAAHEGSTCRKTAKRSGALIFFASFFGLSQKMKSPRWDGAKKGLWDRNAKIHVKYILLY